MDVTCPCCHALLTLDASTGQVLAHKEGKPPPPITDIAQAAQALKKAPERRDGLFKQSMESEKSKSERLKKSFEVMLKKTKENPDVGPEVRGLDLD